MNSLVDSLQPYEGAIQVLLRVQGVLVVGVALCIVLLEREVSFARKRAGDPNWQQWPAFPRFLNEHRKMFPGSWLRRASLLVAFLFIACTFATFNLIRRDQQRIDLYRASLPARMTHSSEVR